MLQNIVNDNVRHFALNMKEQYLESLLIDRINASPQDLVMARLRCSTLLQAIAQLEPEKRTWIIQQTLKQEKFIK